MNSLELCAGAGGQAQGLERAGFKHVAHVELDAAACSTMGLSRIHWHLVENDLSRFNTSRCRGIDLVAGGIPRPPFSKAGK